MSETVASIRAFIFENFLFDEDEQKLANDDSFLDQGIVDSTGMLELVRWVQDTFGIEISDDELLPENLDSVNKVAGFIAGKRSAVGAATPGSGEV